MAGMAGGYSGWLGMIDGMIRVIPHRNLRPVRRSRFSS